MQANSSANSYQQLEDAKQRLKNAITRLEKAVNSQSKALHDEREMRNKLVQDFESQMQRLEIILNNGQ